MSPLPRIYDYEPAGAGPFNSPHSLEPRFVKPISPLQRDQLVAHAYQQRLNRVQRRLSRPLLSHPFPAPRRLRPELREAAARLQFPAAARRIRSGSGSARPWAKACGRSALQGRRSGHRAAAGVGRRPESGHIPRSSTRSRSVLPEETDARTMARPQAWSPGDVRWSPAPWRALQSAGQLNLGFDGGRGFKGQLPRTLRCSRLCVI